MSSRRQYATIAEVEELADVTSTNDAEFEDRISQAEELIDAYVGYQPRFFAQTVRGKATAVSGRTVFDTSDDSPLDRDNDWYTYCVIKIIGGTGAGQERSIESSSKSAKSVTASTDWTTQPDNTSIFEIYQLGKFPRTKDLYREPDSLTYYKSIPEAVKRATAAQVQFIIEMGDDYFAGEDAEMDGERIMSYSYSRGGNSGQSAVVKFLSPKARTLLRGIKNRGGKLVRDNPTWL